MHAVCDGCGKFVVIYCFKCLFCKDCCKCENPIFREVVKIVLGSGSTYISAKYPGEAE